jgi:hypothetical protein
MCHRDKTRKVMKEGKKRGEGGKRTELKVEGNWENGRNKERRKE